MKINLDKLFNFEKQQFEKLSLNEKFKYALSIQAGNPYGWGKENQFTSDCSGSVCFALLCCGYPIRCTADVLFNEIFTEKSNGMDALFFITLYEKLHFDRMVKAGTVVHVAGYIADKVCLNAQNPRSIIIEDKTLMSYFNLYDYKIIKRGLNIDALSEIVNKGKYNNLDDFELKEVIE